MSEHNPRFPFGKKFKIKQEFTFEVVHYYPDDGCYEVMVNAPLPEGVAHGCDISLVPVEDCKEYVTEEFLLSLTPQGRKEWKEERAKAIRNEIAALQRELEALEGDKKKKK